jgi:hypothetical protein
MSNHPATKFSTITVRFVDGLTGITYEGELVNDYTIDRSNGRPVLGIELGANDSTVVSVLDNAGENSFLFSVTNPHNILQVDEVMV